MNIVDSSAWLEFFADGPKAQYFSGPLTDLANLIVPTITIYEVFKVVLRERGEDSALQAIAMMKQGKEIDLSGSLAIEAARISHEHKVPMADSIILATAWAHQAEVWTMDEDFKGLQGVQYFPK